MSAARRINLLSRVDTDSLKDLYARKVFSSYTQPLTVRALQQKALQTLSAPTIAIGVAATSLSGTENSAPTTDGNVHWQSAFWALVAIALNSCLQESGNICEIEAKFGLLIKSSPVLCVVDTFIVWGQLIFYLTRVPPREAVRIVAKSRQQHDPDTANESTSFTRVVARCLLLVLAVLQGLKLYALRGIPWTQAFGTMYFLSYLTNAILNVLGRPEVPERPPQSDMQRGDIWPSTTFIRYWAGVAACFQIAIWTALVRSAIPQRWLTILVRENCRWPVNVVTFLGLSPIYLLWGAVFFFFQAGAILVDLMVLVLPPAIILAALYVLNGKLKKFLPNLFGIIADAFGCSVNTMMRTFAAMTSIVAIVLETCFLGAFRVTTKLFTSNFLQVLIRPVDYMSENWDRYQPYGLSFLILSVVAIVSNGLYRPFLIGSMAQKLGTARCGISSNLAWAVIFMFVANVSLAVLYYCYVYDPEGTWEPAWTENLGRK